MVAESHLDDDEGPEKEAPAPAPAKEPDVPALAPDQLATSLAASAGAALPNAVTRAPQAAQAAVAGVVPQLAANVSDLSHLSPGRTCESISCSFWTGTHRGGAAGRPGGVAARRCTCKSSSVSCGHDRCTAIDGSGINARAIIRRDGV